MYTWGSTSKAVKLRSAALQCSIAHAVPAVKARHNFNPFY